jgi:hypothetical protein
MTIAALVMRVPISGGEVLGAFGGFLGMLLLCFDTAHDKEVNHSLPFQDFLCKGCRVAFIRFPDPGP